MDYPRFPISEMHLGKLELQSWTDNFKTEVCAKSAFLDVTMRWIKEVQITKSIDDLMTAQSITGRKVSLMRWMRQHWKIFSRMCTSEKEQVSKSDVLRKTTDSYEEGRLLTWSMSIFGPPLVKQYKDSQICSKYAYRMLMFKISTQDGTKFFLEASEIPTEMVLEGVYKSKLHRILFSFRLCWLCLNKRIFDTTNNQAIPDWRHPIIGMWKQSKSVRCLERIHEVQSIKRETSKRMYVVREGDKQKFKPLRDLSICGLKSGRKWDKPLRRKRNKNGQTRSPNSAMLEDWKAYLSLIWKMVNIEKPSKTQGESWMFQWRRQCFAKEDQRSAPAFRKLKRRVANPTRFQKTKHACIVEAHESARQRLESSLPKDHEDRIAGKGYDPTTHDNLVHKFIPVPQSMKLPDAKAAVDKEWKTRNGSSMAVGTKRRLFCKHRETKNKVRFATLMDIFHLKNAE